MFKFGACALTLLSTFLLAGCSKPVTSSTQIDFQLGEKVPIGPLTYTVVETRWVSQLGEGFNVRVPKQRFFLVTLAVTNGGGKEVSLPFMTMQDSNGKLYTELESGEGVEGWFGLLRNIAPAQTQQGRLLFDVPLTSFKLKLPDGGDPGEEKYAGVLIPLRIDSDTVTTPLPSGFK